MVMNMAQDTKVNTILVPLGDLYSMLKMNMGMIKYQPMFDYDEYVRLLLNYIFDENPDALSTLGTTACRTMLINEGFSEEQFLWFEHRALVIALTHIGDTVSFIKTLSRRNQISGYYWNITQAKDLVFSMVYV